MHHNHRPIRYRIAFPDNTYWYPRSLDQFILIATCDLQMDRVFHVRSLPLLVNGRTLTYRSRAQAKDDHAFFAANPDCPQHDASRDENCYHVETELGDEITSTEIISRARELYRNRIRAFTQHHARSDAPVPNLRKKRARRRRGIAFPATAGAIDSTNIDIEENGTGLAAHLKRRAARRKLVLDIEYVNFRHVERSWKQHRNHQWNDRKGT